MATQLQDTVSYLDRDWSLKRKAENREILGVTSILRSS